MPRTSPSPPHRGTGTTTGSYRPDDRRRRRSSDARPPRRSRSRSPGRHQDQRDHYSPRRSPRPHPRRGQPPLPYDEPNGPPLPNEAPPPLPNEAPPPLLSGSVPSNTAGAPGTTPSAAAHSSDDGWEPVWEPSANTYYFYNRFTGATQWENPRVPDATAAPPQPEEPALTIKPAAEGGYNPAIHGSYDPNADYAQHEQPADAAPDPAQLAAQAQNGDDYAATAQFNRFTGRFQTEEEGPGRHSDDAKARRQMNAFFDVDAAANRHDGRSLRAERQNRRLTKDELKAFRERNKERKEQKRRAWLKD